MSVCLVIDNIPKQVFFSPKPGVRLLFASAFPDRILSVEHRVGRGRRTLHHCKTFQNHQLHLGGQSHRWTKPVRFRWYCKFRSSKRSVLIPIWWLRISCRRANTSEWNIPSVPLIWLLVTLKRSDWLASRRAVQPYRAICKAIRFSVSMEHSNWHWSICWSIRNWKGRAGWISKIVVRWLRSREKKGRCWFVRLFSTGENATQLVQTRIRCGLSYCPWSADHQHRNQYRDGSSAAIGSSHSIACHVAQ